MDKENTEYFQYVRTDLIDGIPKGNHRILEVGCAEGNTGRALKRRGCASEVVGIELMHDAAQVAKTKLDRVVFGDIEQLDFNEVNLRRESFDYILCGDVLEHLRDPWRELERLLNLLKVGGQFIVSLPNVRYYGVVFPLLFKGDFTYQSAGILDKTHLHFFTKSTAMKMLTNAGLVELEPKGLRFKRRDKLLYLGTAGLLAGVVSSQWVIVATKAK